MITSGITPCTGVDWRNRLDPAVAAPNPTPDTAIPARLEATSVRREI
jgi:hypothetical protein